MAYTASRNEDPEVRTERVTPADAFGAALRTFVEEPRLDMIKLAANLGISKATLYRWTGSRERLLADVLTYYSDIAFDQAEKETAELQGLERVTEVGRIYIGMIVTFEPLRRFFKAESPLALRILTTRGGSVQTGAVKRITALLLHEQEQNAMKLRAPAEVLAYAMTRMIEGFIYNDPLADIEPDIDEAIVIVALLLE